MKCFVQSSCLGIMCVLIGPKHGLYAVKDGPANGVLLHVRDEMAPTTFETKKLAQAAIARTRTYFKKINLPMDEDALIILTENQYESMLEDKLDRKRKRRAKNSNHDV